MPETASTGDPLPAPTGRYPVGRVAYHWRDPSRPDRVPTASSPLALHMRSSRSYLDPLGAQHERAASSLHILRPHSGGG